MLIGKMTGNISSKIQKIYEIRSIIEYGPEKELYVAYTKGIEIMSNNSEGYSSWSEIADDILSVIRNEHKAVFEESFLLTENIGGKIHCPKCEHSVFYVILFRTKKVQAYCAGCELAIHE